MTENAIGKYLSISRRSQLSLLMSLYTNEGGHQQKLGRIFNINKAAVSLKLRNLGNKNYIPKKEQEDQRKLLIFLTPRANRNKSNIISKHKKLKIKRKRDYQNKK